jgi:hypothetical protein
MARKLSFYSPERVLSELKHKYDGTNVPELMNELNKSKEKENRELFYGSILCIGLKFITKHEIFMKTASEEPADIELFDKTIPRENQNRSKKQREINHWRVQNVLITEHVLKGNIEKGIDNFYEIVSEHLMRTKFAIKKDYQGLMLHMHLKLKLRGFASVYKLKDKIRAIDQDNFDQLWVTNFSTPKFDKCSITELLCYDFGLVEFPIFII